MGDFRSFKTAARHPAEPMQPVIDPADGSPESLKDVASWSYRMSDRDADELTAGVAAVRRASVAIVDIKRASFPLQAFGDDAAVARPRRGGSSISRKYCSSAMPRRRSASRTCSV